MSNLLCNKCWFSNQWGSRYCGNCGCFLVDLWSQKLDHGYKSFVVMFGILFVVVILLGILAAVTAIADKF